MARRTPSFRFASKYVFLTYTHSAFTVIHLIDFLKQLLHRFQPQFIAAAEEHHDDGDTHIHALVQCSRRIDTNNPLFFDFQEVHPNIQPARNSRQVLDYISKDGQPTTWGDFQDHRVSPTKRDDKWRLIISTATSYEHYIQMVKEMLPAEWATRLQFIEYSARQLFPIQEPVYQNPFNDSDFQCHENLSQWLNEELYVEPPRRTRPKSLYICGPTRTGKTSWARSLGRHNYWNGGIDFSTYDCNATYNIIDDIPFKYVANWKQLVSSQKDYIVNPKYGKRKRIPGGIPCIILCNKDEDWFVDMNKNQADYFSENCTIHYMEDNQSFIVNT